MSDAERYRKLARECRERAEGRSAPKDKELMEKIAAEFERLANDEERQKRKKA